LGSRAKICGMSRTPLHTSAQRRALNPGVEYEYERLTISRELTRNAVTRMLVDRAEHGGWELDRLRLSPDGTRRVVLRRKIIRQRSTYFV
jgi:Family of unknown function (DUF5703)